MADQNSYLRYKRDTRQLIYWMVQSSNRIIHANPESAVAESAGGVPLSINRTGQISVSEIASCSRLIAKHSTTPVPSIIYRLFQSVISARKDFSNFYQNLFSKAPDSEIEKNNQSHLHFLHILSKAFKVLGGEDWYSAQKLERNDLVEEDYDDKAFLNKFSSLDVSKDDVNDNDPETDEEPEIQAQHRKKTTNKGKKNGRGKKAKPKAKPGAREDLPVEIPLESYRIIESEEGIITDYLMAVYCLVTEWAKLRHFIQGLWRQVAYDGLNSAVAATVSNVAIGILKKTESDMFLDFPGHDSYDVVMKTITRGDVEKSRNMFSVSLQQVKTVSGIPSIAKVKEAFVDVEEHFMIHVYQDLHDFIMDFQKNRNGKPTKRMLSEIRDWDPKLNLSRASKEERIKWRRSYTINWLYDLMNVFSSVVVQRINVKKQAIDLATVDWSPTGPWTETRVLYGVNEFAGHIASLAYQKPDTDIRGKILPHHVFQMACIVDSLAVSCGWSNNILKGHILTSPASAFSSRRDVDLFLDRHNKNFGRGYCQSVEIAVQLLDRDAMLHGNPNRHRAHTDMLNLTRDDFVNWLGETKYMHGLDTIPPSRFSNTNTNGLWEHSPFLCGSGLAEALELAYAVSFRFWDRMPEPLCLIHLHNMLVQKGYIKKEIGMYSTLSDLFHSAFFIDNKPPTSEFLGAFTAIIKKSGGRQVTMDRNAVRRNVSRTASGISALYSMDSNRFYTQRSLLAAYREADFVPDKIPDNQLPPRSLQFAVRLDQTSITIDPKTKKRSLKDTPLVQHARAAGVTDDSMIEMSYVGLGVKPTDALIDPAIIKAMKANVPEGYTMDEDFGDATKAAGKRDIATFLEFLKTDIVNDVSGQLRPLSALNYAAVTGRFMMLFMQFEEKLRKLRNPLYIAAYEKNMVEKRATLTRLVLGGDDDQCMRVMAQEFENPRTGFMQHIYWDDLDSLEKQFKRKDDADNDGPVGDCSVM